MNDEHDPSQRHPRAQKLIADELWHCADEEAPFGSDEGAEAYESYRRWRADNPEAPLTDCIDWIGDESAYPDEFTFDSTIIATVLGQLAWEGRIDAEAKVFARTAIERQMIGASKHRRSLLEKTLAAIDAG